MSEEIIYEIYKEIKDFPNYCVSNLGNVKNNNTNKILKQRIKKNGYLEVQLSKLNKSYHKYIHRLVIDTFLDNNDNKKCVDHINGNKIDNNLKNLRWATHKQNGQNSKIRKDNTSSVKGVCFNKYHNKWHARIKIDGISIHLGYYDNLEDAKEVRIKAAKAAFKEFLNECEIN